MMRFSLFYSAVCQYRNLHLFITRNTYIQNCVQCAKLRRAIPMVHVKTFCQRSNKTSLGIDHDISVKDIADKLGIKASCIIELLKEYEYDTNNGIKTTLNMDVAELIADEYGFSVYREESVSKSHFTPRPPIITIMGHVDHGKTTLLDNLRDTTVAKYEAGGITQSIGAFSVKVPGLNDTVTFVDTPGHAAFNSMRARGAQLTDIVVLMIAAEDGIMQQTKECLKHIRAANVPFIVAINKIDMPNAKPEKIKRDLLAHDVQLEGYGGDTKYVEISALKGTNIDNLLLLLNDFAKKQQFRSLHKDPVMAVVLEAEQNKRQGIVASMIIKTGKLTKGKILLAGTAVAKVRQILNANGEAVTAAFPSDPVQILGWRSLPIPGDEAIEMENEGEARGILKLMAQEAKPVKVVRRQSRKAIGKEKVPQEFRSGQGKRRLPYRVTLRREAAAGLNVETDENKELNIVIKADVSGSLEALLGILSKFYSEHMKLNIMNASVGQVSAIDLQFSRTFNGIVYCFNSEIPKDVMKEAEQLGVSVRSFDVIYKLLDDMKEEIERLLPPRVIEHIIGEGDVLKTFVLTGGMKCLAAGCRVTSGSFDKSKKGWRVVRNNNVVHEGVITSLKHGAADILIAKQFSECGLILKNFEDFQEGDKILCVEKEEVRTTFDWKL